MFIVPGIDEPLVSPKDIIGDVEYPDRGLIIFTEAMADAVRKLTHINYDLSPSNKPYKITYLERELTLLYPYYGAPATILAFEMAVAGGLREAVVVGEAGAIAPGVRISDYILPTWGVMEEGTSYHYMPMDYTPRIENKLYEFLLDTLRREGCRVHVGGVWSIDAIFRETRDKIRRYGEMGVLCVDMEATALMTVAEYRGVEIAILLVVSDELYHDKWVRGWGTEKLKEAEYNAVKKALETIAKYPK